MKDFKDLIEPIQLDAFIREYWCEKSFYLKGNKEKYSSLFSWTKLNAILNSNQTPHPNVFIANAGNKETPKTYQDLINALQKGGTMVIEDVDRYDANLSNFLNQISHEFMHNTRFNLYLSYPGKAGYVTHYDTHDVFILQIKGAKRWKVFDATIENPLFFQKKHGIIAPPKDSFYIDEILYEGDFLYIPRGHWHNALAENDLSLHLTLAVFPRTGVFFMNWLTDEVTENTEFRKNFPLIFPQSREDVIFSEYQNHIDNLKDKLIELINQPEIIDKFYDYMVSATKIRPRIGLPYIINFNAEDDLEHLTYCRPSRIFRIKKHVDKTVIVIGSKRIALSRNCNPLVEFVFKNDSFTFANLMEHTSMEKHDVIKIVKLLISEGIIIASEGSYN